MKNQMKRMVIILCLGVLTTSLTACGAKDAGANLGSANETVVDGTKEVSVPNDAQSGNMNVGETSDNIEIGEKDVIDEVEETGLAVVSKEVKHNADGTSYTQYNYQYDSLGNCIVEQLYDEDGSLSRLIEYEYDSNGNVIKELYTNSDGEMYRGYEYAYDMFGNQIKYAEYDKDSGAWIIEFEKKYDDTGKLLYFTEYQSTGEVFSSEEYIYEASGCVIKNRNWLGTNWRYTYDEANRLLETLRYNDDGGVDYKVQYEYDENGKLINEYSSNSNVLLDSSCHYEYDSLGRVIKKTYTYEEETPWIDLSKPYRMEFIYTDGTNYCKGLAYNMFDKIDWWVEYEIEESTGNFINPIYHYNNNEYDMLGIFFDFNEAGNVIKAERHIGDGTIILLYTGEYDENGVLRKEYGIDYWEDWEDTSSEEYADKYEYEKEYDINATLIKETIYEDDKTTISEYYPTGVLKQLTEETEGQTIIRTYNENGEFIVFRNETDEKKVYTTREYDKNNNLKTITVNINGKLDYWTEYIYEYIDLPE